jgi:putative ABC transport system permease protein
MRAPRWARAVVRKLAPQGEADVLIGDLEEAHRTRLLRRTRLVAAFLTSLEAVDIALMLIRRRLRLPRPSISWLDLKLAMRMLVRYPVLTVIGTVSLSAAIALGASAFAAISMFMWPRMPLPDGDQIVLVTHRDTSANRDETRVAADYFRLRSGTNTLTDFAAGRSPARNLAMGDGIVEPITVAEVTPSTFAMTRVAPIAGRTLTDEDATAAAPPVMLLGERIWRERFGADPSIVGRALLLSDKPTTVVGIMPAGFRFPSIHEVWQPLKLEEGAARPRAGFGMRIWARLKPGVTQAEANSELEVLSAQAAVDWPATHEHLKASVGPPMESEVSDPSERLLITSMNAVVALLVLLVSGNVALLMFARAATRESEIVVRTALGASRGRLIAQFFSEALVLSTIAGVTGLLIARQIMWWGVNTFTVVANGGEMLPFWVTAKLPPGSIVYGIALAGMAAVVTGVLPAMKMTRAVSSQLRERTAGGGGGVSFGGVWTVAIAGQIAVTMVLPVIMFFLGAEYRRSANHQIGVPADRYLTASLGRESNMPQVRYEALVRRVRDDLAATPGIGQVTVADRLPFMWNGHYLVKVEGGGAVPLETDFGDDKYRITTASVESDYFSTFEAKPLAGRLFNAGDYVGPARVVVVNQSFVEKVLGGRNAIGRRIHYTWASNGGQAIPTGTPPTWFEIVGVVRDLGMAVPGSINTAGAYLPLTLRNLTSPQVMIAARVSGDMAAATNTLRSIARNADPTLRVDDVQPLSQIPVNGLKTMRYVIRTLGIAGTIGFMLALSGLYAVMSFAVSRRTREIGIRVALGSTGLRVVFTILRTPMIQAAIGSVLGGILAFAFPIPNLVTFAFVMGFVAYAIGVFVVCMLASVVPARRALRVDPITALRSE